MKDNLIHTAINEILKEYKVDAFWEDLIMQGIDGMIKLNYKGHTQEFYVEVKRELREYQLPNIFKLKEEYDPIMVIAEKLFPKIKNTLVEQGIAYIEMDGNINIEADNILLKVEGKRKKYLQQEKYGRAFTKAGLKALFLFLTNENDMNDTYREIAKNAGIAHGNIKLILAGLIEEGFALQLNEKLKPALKLGEPAGNVYTKFLQPEYLRLYTNEKKADLIKNYKLIPDLDGNVIVYEKFWKVGLEFYEFFGDASSCHLYFHKIDAFVKRS